jgi:HPt (histidine-containing phosphotransfer) domain-containing protein
MLAQVQSAVALRDVAKLRFTAHTLRGALANFGARRAVDASQALESRARQGTLDDVDECFRELESAWVELEQAMLAQLGQDVGKEQA